jgi:hypothetical protein
MLRYFVKNTVGSVTLVQCVEGMSKAIVDAYIATMDAHSHSSTKNEENGEMVFASQIFKNVSLQDAFEQVPSIKLTMNNNAVSVPYKTNVTVNGFQIRFQTPFSGTVSWEAVYKI